MQNSVLIVIIPLPFHFNIAIRRFLNESFKTLLQRAHMECDWLLRGFSRAFEDKEQIITRQPFRGLDCTQDVKLGKSCPSWQYKWSLHPGHPVLLTLSSRRLLFLYASPSRLPPPSVFCTMQAVPSSFPGHPSRVTQALSLIRLSL